MRGPLGLGGTQGKGRAGTFGDHSVPAIPHGERRGAVLHLQQKLHTVHRRRRRAAHRPCQPCTPNQASHPHPRLALRCNLIAPGYGLLLYRRMAHKVSRAAHEG